MYRISIRLVYRTLTDLNNSEVEEEEVSEVRVTYHTKHTYVNNLDFQFTSVVDISCLGNLVPVCGDRMRSSFSLRSG